MISSSTVELCEMGQVPMVSVFTGYCLTSPDRLGIITAGYCVNGYAEYILE